MKDDLKLLREAFERKQRRFLRLKPAGLFIGEYLVSTLSGRITSWIMVRKLFRKGKVVCQSDTGIEGDGAERCEKCTRQGCSQKIRLHIDPIPGGQFSGVELILELNFSSAKNFLQYSTDLAGHRAEVSDVISSFSVINRDRWGEVVFEVDRSPKPIPLDI